MNQGHSSPFSHYLTHHRRSSSPHNLLLHPYALFYIEDEGSSDLLEIALVSWPFPYWHLAASSLVLKGQQARKPLLNLCQIVPFLPLAKAVMLPLLSFNRGIFARTVFPTPSAQALIKEPSLPPVRPTYNN